MSGSLSGENYRIVFPEAGPRVWVAQAKTLRADSDQRTLTLLGVACELYQAGRPVLTVTAERGQAQLVDRQATVTLSGQVVATQAGRGTRLEAEQFVWDSSAARIQATRVRWQGAGLVHQATRGTFNTALTRAAFTGQVQTAVGDAP